jgi:comEA protein
MRAKGMYRVWAWIICLGLALAPVAVQAHQAKAPVADKVNINTATAEQLQALPGIGPALAKTIIEHRTKNGKFNKIEEILNVRGVGEKMFQKMKDRLVV